MTRQQCRYCTCTEYEPCITYPAMKLRPGALNYGEQSCHWTLPDVCSACAWHLIDEARPARLGWILAAIVVAGALIAAADLLVRFA